MSVLFKLTTQQMYNTIDVLVNKKDTKKVEKMKLVKKVREYAGLNPWKMHKLMNKRTVQAYLRLERDSQRISLDDLSCLEKIYLDAGGTKENFSALIRECR